MNLLFISRTCFNRSLFLQLLCFFSHLLQVKYLDNQFFSEPARALDCKTLDLAFVAPLRFFFAGRYIFRAVLISYKNGPKNQRQYQSTLSTSIVNFLAKQNKTTQIKMKVSLRAASIIKGLKLIFLFSSQFAVAGLLALFAVAAQSSAVWPYSAWAHAPALHAPITQYSSWPAVHAHAYAPAAISYAHHVAAPHHVAVAPHHVVAAPVHHAYASHVVAAPVHHHGATYTAANRGSVHTAPLPGHIASQTSLNLAPAPGTH